MQIDKAGASRGQHSRLLLISLTFSALVVYLAMNNLMVGEIVGEFWTRGISKSLVYGLWVVLGFITFCGVLLTAPLPMLAAVVIAACISAGTNYAYVRIAGRDITPDLMEWMAHEVSQLRHAWVEFMPEIVDATGRAIGLIALLLVIRAVIHRRNLVPEHMLYGHRARALALGSFLIFHGATMLLQPSYTVAETNVFVFGIPAAFSAAPQPRAVTIRAADTPPAEKIVFVIDESVGRRVYADVVAPMLAHLPVMDFGLTASLATCSAPSNALLRWGLEKDSIGKAGYDPRTNPTIWGFAKAAGFRTTLIDGQSKGTTQNFVTRGELALIDQFIGADTGLDTDRRIAATLNEHLSRPGRELIYVVKRGAHFPYNANYPEGNVADDASKKTKYAAAVSYSTGGFFAALSDRLRDTSLLLIYTSDHGQNLDSRALHCSDEYHTEEYSTPLLVLSDAPSMRNLLAGAVPRMKDRASHVNVFPTLLYALGYERGWVEATYGPTLAGPPTPYVALAWHLPYPTRRHPTVEFIRTDSFPGRHVDEAKSDNGR